MTPTADITTTLTAAEQQVVALVVVGYSNREVARRLSISPQAVGRTLQAVFEKLGVSDRLELALFAIYHRLSVTEKL